MFRNKNHGLDIDLINTAKSVMGGVGTKKEEINESEIIDMFSKYLDENFHVDQLTEEEIQWIYENEFYNQLNEEERSSIGKLLDYLPGLPGLPSYKQTRKNLEAKAKELKGKTTLDAIGTTLKDFAKKAPSALAYIPAGRAASTAANAARAVATRSPTSTAVRKPTTAVATRSPTSSAGPQGQRTGVGSGGSRGIDPKKAREKAQTIPTTSDVAAKRRATAALAGTGAAGAIVASNSTGNKGGAGAGEPSKTGPATGSYRAAQEVGSMTKPVTAKDRKKIFSSMPGGDPNFVPPKEPVGTSPGASPATPATPATPQPTKPQPTKPQPTAPAATARRKPRPARPARASGGYGSDRPTWQQRALKVGSGMEDLA